MKNDYCENVIMNDSFSVVEAECIKNGVAFPKGDRKEVITNLSSDYYENWHPCSAKEACLAANKGIMSVGITPTDAFIVEADSELTADTIAETTFFSQAEFIYGADGKMRVVPRCSCPESCTACISYYEYEDGPFISAEEVPLYSAITIASPPDRPGYEFSHWVDSYGWTLYPEGSYSVYGDTEFYGVWEKIPPEHIFTWNTNYPLSECDRELVLSEMDAYYNDESNGLGCYIDKVDENGNSKRNTCIFAFEGLGDPSLKDEEIPTNRKNVSDIHPIWLYNAMMVVTKGREIVYITRRASTLPDLIPGPLDKSGKSTTLKEEIYDYQTGNHALDDEKPSGIGEGTYIALVPCTQPQPSWYKENGEFVCGTATGVNIHAGHMYFFKDGSNNSEGCQFVHFKDYISFGKAVGFLNESAPSDLTSINGNLGPTLHKTIGAVGYGEKDYSQQISVKYILCRKYDNQNPYKCSSDCVEEDCKDNSALYPNGVFYPINHEHYDGLCIL